MRALRIASPWRARAPNGGTLPAREASRVSVAPRKIEHRIGSYASSRLEDWQPETPGRLDALYMHWSAHDYESVFPAYHFCLVQTQQCELVVVTTHDVRTNMRDVYASDAPYAQHTRRRNSFAVGISAMAMQDATPYDFGLYPLTERLVDGLSELAAKLCAFYAIPVRADRVMTHAEAALHDGYFGTAPDERWDLARFEARPEALRPSDALASGEKLRERIRRYAEQSGR